MIKLTVLLAVGMFLTLLIGGEDNGQTRQGLVGVTTAPAIERPVLRQASAKPMAQTPTKPEPEADLLAASFSPVIVQPPPFSAIPGAFTVSGTVSGVSVAAVEPVTSQAAPADDMPIMYVNARSVNVRGGPSTEYEVVGRLSRAEAVTVLSAAEDGWVRISIEGDGLEGFIAARLLSDTDPAAN
ncbi:SH3 domain-containing protein [Pseudorhodobacter sp.]|uniref:SH3 domain-containing protein n=1 Tax=Pseudorhodobacter sp. TaxID=1934400 RepID=UPI002AFF5AC5|nr:SH3 domain-containing protein [Pseudorhodobacter sp.]